MQIPQALNQPDNAYTTIQPGETLDWELTIRRTDALGSRIDCSVGGWIEVELPLIGGVLPPRVLDVFGPLTFSGSTGPIGFSGSYTVPSNLDGSKATFLSGSAPEVRVEFTHHDICRPGGCEGGENVPPLVPGSHAGTVPNRLCVMPTGERSRWWGNVYRNRKLMDAIFAETNWTAGYYNAERSNDLAYAHVVSGELLPHAASFEGRLVGELTPASSASTDGCDTAIAVSSDVEAEVRRKDWANERCKFVSVSEFRRYHTPHEYFDVGRGAHPFDRHYRYSPPSPNTGDAPDPEGQSRGPESYWADSDVPAGSLPNTPPVDFWGRSFTCSQLIAEQLAAQNNPSSDACSSMVVQEMHMPCDSTGPNTAYEKLEQTEPYAVHEVELTYTLVRDGTGAPSQVTTTLRRGGSPKTGAPIPYPIASEP